MRRCLIYSILPLAIALQGCDPGAEKAKPIGEAYAGPIVLPLRQEITPNSKVVVSVKHGDHLDILQTRRRFVKVRTAAGTEGWTDTRQLLTPEQMKEIKNFGSRVRSLPSMGAATVFSTLNIHSEPNRTSPSIYQIVEGTLVDVVSHHLSPRVAAPSSTPALPIVKPPPPPRRKKAEKKEPAIPKPPRGPAPKVPSNWLELSQTGKTKPAQDEGNAANQTPAKAEKPKTEEPADIPLDDWSLVRTRDGKAGWVLTRMLNMAIPDEVAQYAEGHRITSYFPMRKVHDGDLVKDEFLWTTIAGGGHPYDFDSFRYFIWSTRHHRYETAYIEKRVIGYFPVEVHPGPSPSFVVFLEDDDGKVWRETYNWNEYRFRISEKVPAQKPAQFQVLQQSGNTQIATTGDAAPAAKLSFIERVKHFFQRSP